MVDEMEIVVVLKQLRLVVVFETRVIGYGVVMCQLRWMFVACDY